ARSERHTGSRPGQEATPGGLHVHVRQPFMLPFSSVAAVRRLNRRSVIDVVQRVAAELEMLDPIVVSTVPNACDFVGSLGARRIAYYCVDDFTQWPGLEHELVGRMERELIERSDVLIATSHNLYNRLLRSGKRTYLLSHGVDLSLFAREAPAEHECLAKIPRPRAGCFGLFDERSDQSLIAALARRLPDHSFVFTGPVATDATRLRALANVHFTGAVPYEELPALIKGLDTLFIPYVVNDFTATISPLKLKEYLVTGRPVITTAMAEALLQKEHLTVARTVDEWEMALRSGAFDDLRSRKQAMLRLMTGESWGDKARRFVEICGTAGV
ncbi:MAG: glycosyltransferase, partial [Steroidobacteraceae bacterium]